MIESIKVFNSATFGDTPVWLTGLSRFNYLFGSNATSKTTISRIIEDETKFPACCVSWKKGTKLQPMVYSRDFVERNFAQSKELKAVFTLGEEQVETIAKITSLKKISTS